MNSNLEAPRQSTGEGDYGVSSGLKGAQVLDLDLFGQIGC